jgi:HD-like signal output (HDOD) protein
MSKSLIIPPRPDSLIVLQKLMANPEPDLTSLAKLIKKDVALYSILLSIVNSPLYRRSVQINSIDQAIVILGANKVFTLLQSIIMRSSLESSDLLEGFWNSAIEVAHICSMIAEQFIIIDTEMAYNVGMLHAAGIPLMMQNFAEYRAFHQQYVGLPTKQLCLLEREHFDTDHYQQGYELTQYWNLDDNVSLSLRYQPITNAIIKNPKHLPTEVPTLLALLKIAKAISPEYSNYWMQAENEQALLQNLKSPLEFLHISQDDLYDLREQVQPYRQAS